MRQRKAVAPMPAMPRGKKSAAVVSMSETEELFSAWMDAIWFHFQSIVWLSAAAASVRSRLGRAEPR